MGLFQRSQEKIYHLEKGPFRKKDGKYSGSRFFFFEYYLTFLKAYFVVEKLVSIVGLIVVLQWSSSTNDIGSIHIENNPFLKRMPIQKPQKAKKLMGFVFKVLGYFFCHTEHFTTLHKKRAKSI